MEKKTKNAIVTAMAISVVVSSVIAMGLLLRESELAVKRNVRTKAYKQGQIDALTGKVKYELVEHDDGTRTWEEIEEEDQSDVR